MVFRLEKDGSLVGTEWWAKGTGRIKSEIKATSGTLVIELTKP